MTDETIYTMAIDGQLTLGDQRIDCPECGASEGLTITAFVDDASTSAQCPNRHVWDIAGMPGKFVRDVYFESLIDPNRTINVGSYGGDGS